MSTQNSVDGRHTSNTLDWIIGSKIRDGRYGPVFLGMRTDTAEFISAEELTPQEEPGGASLLETIEAHLEPRLAIPNQPNVIPYLGYQHKEGRTFILTEYLQGGTLRDLIQSYGALPEPLVRNILRQVALGLEQLRGQSISPVFVDLGVVMMDNVGVVKIEAPLFDVTGRPLPSGILAPPPEILLGQDNMGKADVWLLGAMAAQLLTGRCDLAEGGAAGSFATRIEGALGSALELLVPEGMLSKLDGPVLDLIRQCLSM